VREGLVAMLDRVRASLHRVLTTPVGDGFLPVRLPKDLARRVNVTLGQPICSAEEIERRRNGRERLAKLRADAKAGVKSESAAREPAPVIVYFEKDRNARLFGRIKEALEARSIAYTALEVDTATKAFVMREAKCKEDELPIVFVAATPIGGYNDLVEWDVSGKLATAVFGAPPSPAAKS
jgi:glutaredoxin